MAGPLNLRERRDNQAREIENIRAELFELFNFEKTSQLRVLKAATLWFKKEEKFNRLKSTSNIQNFFLDDFVDPNCLNNFLNGFIVCFEKKKCLSKKKATFTCGELIYISENVQEYFGWNSVDIMLTYDTIQEITSQQDDEYLNNLCSNPSKYVYPNTSTTISNWSVSRIKRKNTSSDYHRFKMTCHYDPNIDAFVALCQPILNQSNRNKLLEFDSMCFSTTHKMNLTLVDVQGNLTDLIMIDNDWRQLETDLYDYLSPQSLSVVAKRHNEILQGRTGRGSIDLVKLITKDFGSIDCLLNMFFDNKQFIVCVYQILSEEDAENYQKSIMMSDSVNSVTPLDVDSDYYDVLSEGQASVETFDSVLVTDLKRCYEDMDEETDVKPNSKQAKVQTDENIGLDLDMINLEDCIFDVDSKQLKPNDYATIDEIKTNLQRECFNLVKISDRRDYIEESDFLGYYHGDELCWENHQINSSSQHLNEFHSTDYWQQEIKF